jgi:hypothetical protein
MRINSVGAGPLPSCKMLLRQISQTNQQASSHLPTARQRRSVAIRRHGSRRLRAQTRSSGAACRSGPNTVVFRSSNKIDKNNDRKVCADKPHPRSAQESRSFSSFPKAPAASGRVKQVSDYTSARISAWRWYYTTAAAPGDPGTGLWTKNGVVKYFSNPRGRSCCVSSSLSSPRPWSSRSRARGRLAGRLPRCCCGFWGLSSGPTPCCES